MKRKIRRIKRKLKNSNKLFLKILILLIILVLIILGVGGYFGYKYLFSGEKVEPTNTVSYEGYEFKVPKSLKTRINSNSLVAYDDTTLLSFLFINGSYDDFSSALVLENFNSLGNTAKYMGEKEKNGNITILFNYLFLF